jgi:hypothetical protein
MPENPVMQKYKNIERNARQKLRSGVGGRLPKFPGVTGIIDPEGSERSIADIRRDYSQTFSW